MGRLTKKYTGGYGLVKVKDNEQDVESKYPNTLKAIIESFNRLGEYEDLEEQGRLVKLPCKVGDIVYCTPYEIEFDIDKNCMVPGELTGDITEEEFEINFYEDIGKYVFLTREEAEAKLRENK